MSRVAWLVLIVTACGEPTEPALTRTPTRSSVNSDAHDAGVPLRALEWSAPIAPGYEGTACAVLSAPETEDCWLSEWHAVIHLAHHVNFWLIPPGADPAAWCANHDLSTFVFDSSQPDLRVRAPAGGAVRVPAGSRAAVDVHELNAGTDPGTATVQLELELLDVQPGPELFPGVLDTHHIAVPAGAQATLSWSCPVPAGTGVAWMSSHTHRFTDIFQVLADGAEVYRSTTWAEPVQTIYDPPLHPAVITWQAHIVNTLPTTLSWGSSRDQNEMAGVYLLALGARVTCTR